LTFIFCNVIQLILNKAVYRRRSQLAGPLIAWIIMSVFVILSQLFHEAHHYFELFIYQIAMVISQLCTGLPGGKHCTIYETRECLSKLEVFVTHVIHIHNR